MIRILHAADLHLDSPFAALDPSQAAQRREEQREMLRRLGQLCRDRDCQLLLLAGDLFDSDQVYRETADLLREVLGGLRARVFLAPGNHDPWFSRSPYATLPWPENVHIFTSRQLQAVTLVDPAVTVYGAAFTAARDPGLLEGFRAEPSEGPSVCVIHGVLGAPDSPYGPISEETVRDSGLNYLALGHVHRQSVRVLGKTTVAWPGCAMGRGFDETGVKGALYAELDGEACRVEPVPLGGRIYETLTVPVHGEPLADLLAVLPPETKEDIYRITLTGTCPPPDLPALRAALGDRFYALELLDETLPPLELWKDLGEDSLKGEYLRMLKRRFDAAQTDADRRTAVLAAELGLALMEGREVPPL